MNDTKECIMCFSEIDLRAKKCPQCLSVQNKSSNLESNPFVIGGMSLVVAGILGGLFYDSFYPRLMESKVIQELKVSVSDVSTTKEGKSLYVACVGKIDNNSSFKLKDVKFEASFFSGDGKLIDTFQENNKNIIIPPGSKINFRVRGLAQKKKELYNVCKVKIVDAWAI
jgi:hypothetical protein